jgi:lipopolysaccharide/colanic/teichoic acid biosynthesis glycosyltransferase
MKRLFDLLAGALGLVVLAPLLVVIAVWIKLDSPGPVFFLQERVGRFGRPFRIVKFRSMAAKPVAGGALLTVGRDPRITRAGHVLRRFKLDELPQLFNVVKGDMSLVGPRPEVARYIECYPPESRRVVLGVRPGITDPASIAFVNESEVLANAPDPERMYVESILPEKIRLYEQYVATRSFFGDVRLIVRTIRAAFSA